MKLEQRLIKNSKNPAFLGDVLEFAKEIYRDQRWLSGQDQYIDHVLRMALFLQELNIDEMTIASALLYGISDTSLAGDQAADMKELEKRFDPELLYLVQRMSELNKIYYSFRISNKEFNEAKKENLIKMFFALAKDLRVIVVKIASRIDGLNRFNNLPAEAKKIYATETLDVFVPIANRLGLGEVKRKLEDLAFAYIRPEQLEWLRENIKDKYEERQKYLEKFIPRLKKILKKEHVDFVKIDYRAKSYWSTYLKLQRHNMDFEKLYDLVALRVIVKDVETCYRLLGVIHKNFQPISGQIQDYIAKPKDNGYKSIHTTVFLQEDRLSEIQIRTEEMHREAEFGICAHWAYKEKIILQKSREHLELAKEIPQFWKTFKIDFFENTIFAFTPKGDIISLPKGSTPVDFAYSVHSDIGNRCDSAKIDGKIIPLSHHLQNGNVVEVITNRKKKPSSDWLKFVKTEVARSHIKKATASTFSSIFSIPSLIKRSIFKLEVKAKKESPSPKSKTPELYLAGQKGIAVNFAKCCDPKEGDEAKAYLAKYRSAVLHKVACKNFKRVSQKFPEKILDVSWKSS